MYAHVQAGTHGGHQWAQDPLALEVQTVVRGPTWALGVELGSSGRASSVLRSWSVSPGPEMNFERILMLYSLSLSTIYSFSTGLMYARFTAGALYRGLSCMTTNTPFKNYVRWQFTIPAFWKLRHGGIVNEAGLVSMKRLCLKKQRNIQSSCQCV